MLPGVVRHLATNATFQGRGLCRSAEKRRGRADIGCAAFKATHNVAIFTPAVRHNHGAVDDFAQMMSTKSEQAWFERLNRCRRVLRFTFTPSSSVSTPRMSWRFWIGFVYPRPAINFISLQRWRMSASHEADLKGRLLLAGFGPPGHGLIGYSGMSAGMVGLVREGLARPPVLLVDGTADPVVPIGALHVGE